MVSFSSSLALFVPLTFRGHNVFPERRLTEERRSTAFVPILPRTSTTTTFSLDSAAVSSSCTDDGLLVVIREGISEASEGGDLTSWQESVQIVANRLDDGDSLEDAERLLADATSWTAWARAGKMARKYMQPVLMEPTQLQASLEWLETGPLALSKDRIVDLIRQYPKLYLVDPAASFRKVMGVAPRKFRDADVLKDLITNDPSVLQFQYNCDNDCISECGFCWVTYQNRL